MFRFTVLTLEFPQRVRAGTASPFGVVPSHVVSSARCTVSEPKLQAGQTARFFFAWTVHFKIFQGTSLNMLSTSSDTYTHTHTLLTPEELVLELQSSQHSGAALTEIRSKTHLLTPGRVRS